MNKEIYNKIGLKNVEAINLLEDYFKIFKFTQLDILCFLPNLLHESLNLTLLTENLNYGKEGLLRVFKRYFNDKDVDLYARKPEKIANLVYANRGGNGDEKI